MWFEIYSQGELIKRGSDLLGDSVSWDYELMDTPTLSLTLPITYLDVLSGMEEIKLFVNGKCFWGVVTDINQNKAEETLSVSVSHIVHEWTFRQISVNHAIKDQNINIVFKGSDTTSKKGENITASDFNMYTSEVDSFTKKKYIKRAGASAWSDNGDPLTIATVTSEAEDEAGTYDVTFATESGVSVTVSATVSVRDEDDDDIEAVSDGDAEVVDQLEDIYADTNFAYAGWQLNFSDDAADTTIDYVYSRQNKLEALTKTMELTTDLFWRVRFVNEKVLDISAFGDKQQWTISLKPSGQTNIRIIEEPTIDYDLSNVINCATVYSEKSDSGMSSMTLREVYSDTSLQKDGFPCVILHSNVNNERDYSMYTDQYPTLAPNNELEYAVIDEASVALESGVVIEGTFAFNDLSPFSKKTDSKNITDANRIRAAKQAYHAAIRKLKHSRRSYRIILRTEELPAGLCVGDKVRFIYDNSLYITNACSAYLTKLLSYDDWFYVTKISYDISFNGVETDEVTLEKYIRIERDINSE